MKTTSVPANVTLLVHEGTRVVARVPIGTKRVTFGRNGDIRLQDPAFSSVHAEIVRTDDGGLRIRDLGSKNGTYLNGVPIEDAPLRPGDEIEVGRSTLVLSYGPAYDPEDASAGERPHVEAIAPSKIAISLETLRKQAAGDATEEDADGRLIILRDLSEALRGRGGRSRILSVCRRVLSEAFPSSRAFVLIPFPTGHWRDPGDAGPDPPPSQTVASEAVGTRSALLSAYLPEDERFAHAESVLLGGIRTAIAAPLLCNDEPVGVLYVDRLGLPSFDERDIRLLGIAANHVSTVLENTAHMEDLRRANVELAHAQETLETWARELEKMVEARTAEVRRQAAEIQRLADEKDELLGMAAHDIRGPLMVIQGLADLMVDGPAARDPELREDLVQVRQAAHGLGEILGTLLDTKAIESGKFPLERQRLDARTFLEKASPAAFLAAASHGNEVRFDVEPGISIDADPRRLGQVVGNLLLNAVKFSSRGGRITVACRSLRDGSAEVTVTDGGEGIAEEDLARIFGAFEQGSLGRQRGGTGLGLAIAKKIVELHGGRVFVENVQEGGTRFGFAMPPRAEGA